MDIILQVKKKNPLLQITKGTPVTPCSNFLKGLHAQSYNDDTVLQKLQKEHHAPITNRTPCSKQKYTICKLQKESILQVTTRTPYTKLQMGHHTPSYKRYSMLQASIGTLYYKLQKDHRSQS
jgi:hypothetical protein